MNAVILWTVIAVLGLLVSATSVWDSWQDLRASASVGNGRRTIARAMMRAQMLRFVTFGLFTLLGVAVLADWDVRQYVRHGLVLAAMLTLADSVLDALVRQQLLQKDRATDRRL